MKQGGYIRVGAIALMLLFLAPSVIKGVHDFNHRSDFRCLSENEFHFHAGHHHCLVCDIGIPLSYSHMVWYDSNHYGQVISVVKDNNNFVLINRSFFLFTSRAPPLFEMC